MNGTNDLTLREIVRTGLERAHAEAYLKMGDEDMDTFEAAIVGVLQEAGVRGPASTCDPEHPFEVVLPGCSRAEAGTLNGALLAADTLLSDAYPMGGGARRKARGEVIIIRRGAYDATATGLARKGQRRADAEGGAS